MKQNWKSILSALIILLALIGCNREPDVIVVGENWKKVHELQSSDKSFTVEVSGKKQLKVGDDLELHVTSAKAGKLWLIRVDPNDQVDLLFPNELSPDNSIKAYQPLTIPPKDAGYSIAALEPAGHSTVACIVTTGNTDLGAVFDGQNISSKALTLIKQAPEWGIGKSIIEVTAK